MAEQSYKTHSDKYSKSPSSNEDETIDGYTDVNSLLPIPSTQACVDDSLYSIDLTKGSHINEHFDTEDENNSPCSYLRTTALHNACFSDCCSSQYNIENIASFLLNPKATKMQKIECIRSVLLHGLQYHNGEQSVRTYVDNPQHYNKSLDDYQWLENVLYFCIVSPSLETHQIECEKEGDQDDCLRIHKYQQYPILWEIRALCKYLMSSNDYNTAGIEPLKSNLESNSNHRTVQGFLEDTRRKVISSKRIVKAAKLVNSFHPNTSANNVIMCSYQTCKTRKFQMIQENDVKSIAAGTLKRWDCFHNRITISEAMLSLDPYSLSLIRTLYESGVVDEELLTSVANIIGSWSGMGGCDALRDCKYNDSVYVASCFLVDDHRTGKQKLACLEALLSSTWSNHHGVYYLLGGTNEVNKFSLHDLLSFCTDPGTTLTHDWVQYSAEHNAALTLLWEIRAICVSLKQVSKRKRTLNNRLTISSAACTRAADYVTSGAIMIERGLNSSTNILTSTIDAAGYFLVRNSKPSIQQHRPCQGRQHSSLVAVDDYGLDHPATLATRSYTSKARRISDHTRAAAASAVSKFQEVSKSGVKALADRIHVTIDDQNDRSESNTRINDQLTILEAAKHVGLATLGATVLVGDAVSDSAGTIAQYSSYIAADVIEHKYGTAAGQIIRDVSDTVGNIVRTVRHVAFLIAPIVSGHVGTTGVAKMIARDTGRTHARGMYGTVIDETKTSKSVAIEQRVVSSLITPVVPATESSGTGSRTLDQQIKYLKSVTDDEKESDVVTVVIDECLKLEDAFLNESTRTGSAEHDNDACCQQKKDSAFEKTNKMLSKTNLTTHTTTSSTAMSRHMFRTIQGDDSDTATETDTSSAYCREVSLF